MVSSVFGLCGRMSGDAIEESGLMNLLENTNKLEFENEAENVFAKEYPRLNDESEKCSWKRVYNADDLKNLFQDGFLCGALWWKPILCDDYIGEKSELQIRVRNEFVLKSENMVPENINQLTFGWE